jgi:hypothetical protein
MFRVAQGRFGHQTRSAVRRDRNKHNGRRLWLFDHLNNPSALSHNHRPIRPLSSPSM